MRGLCSVALGVILGALGTASAQELDLILVDEEVVGAKVVEIREDGSLGLSAGDRQIELLLAGIRLPDAASSLLERADALLHQRFMGKTVEAHLCAPDDRKEAWIGYALVDGVDPRLELLESGLARYCPHRRREPDLESAERSAREAGRGLWTAAHEEHLPSCKRPVETD